MPADLILATSAVTLSHGADAGAPRITSRQRFKGVVRSSITMIAPDDINQSINIPTFFS
jgi:hypothetical protein